MTLYSTHIKLMFMNENIDSIDTKSIEICKNCGTELKGPFCYNCGQEKKDIHKSFRRLFHDFLGDSFAFDSRFLRTLKALIIRPGFLTKEVIEGRRIRYIPPIKMYLFISFFYFLMLSVTGPYGNSIKIGESPKKNSVVVSEVSDTDKSESEVKAKAKEETEKAMEELKEENSWINDHFVIPLMRKAEKITSDKDKFGEMLVSNFPKAMFLLLPFFALLLKVLFKKTGFFYIEHLIFSLHIHSFGFLTYILVELSTLISGSPTTLLTEITDVVTSLWLLVYLFKSLRHVYKTSFFGTAVRYFFLLFLYLIGFIVSFITIILITVLMY